MSHFTVLVIGASVDEQLAPYDEQKQVLEYETDCHCVGWQAQIDASKETDKQVGSIDTFRKKHDKIPADKRPDWKEFIKPYVELENKLLRQHPLYNKPNPKCKECHGSGKMMTTYNPNSKWDWYSIGGRWTGFFKVKPEAIDRVVLGEPGLMTEKPKDQLKADIVRKRDIDFEVMEKEGLIAARKGFNEAFKKFPKNAEMRDLMYGIQPDISKKAYIEQVRRRSVLQTFAVVKDGKWNEQGEIGWGGAISNRKSDDEWATEFKKLIDNLPDHTLLTVVDCHI